FRHYFHLLLFQVSAVLETASAPELGIGSHHPFLDADRHLPSRGGRKQHTFLQRHRKQFHVH
ncbi:hypothetical protein NPIL_301381, partial [Nephila pilipes]